MRTTYKEKYRVIESLSRYGITFEHANTLRRISMTLRNWYEKECGVEGGCIERNETTGKPFWYNSRSRFIQANDSRAYTPIPDRENGALKRLAKIMANYPELTYYVQTDPRGAALYILKKSDVEGLSIESVYNRGTAVY